MRKLYVCSRPLLGKDRKLHQHLIGVLKQLDNKEYQFRYRLDDSAESSRLMLPIFPDINKIYNDAETRVLLDDYLPSENDTAFINHILKKTGLDHYDEWTWLLTFDSDDANAETFLYETLPEGIIRHDENIINDDDLDEIENDFDVDLNDFDDLSKFEEPDEPESFDENDFNQFDKSDESDEFNIPDFYELENVNKSYEKNPDNKNFPTDDFFSDDIPFDNPDNDDNENNGTLPNTSIINSAPIIKKLDPKPKNTVRVITVKTTYKRQKHQRADDFIEPPPESPIDKIQQRLKDNQKARKERLDEMLKNNSYTT